jgi:hypothetical protein
MNAQELRDAFQLRDAFLASPRDGEVLHRVACYALDAIQHALTVRELELGRMLVLLVDELKKGVSK